MALHQLNTENGEDERKEAQATVAQKPTEAQKETVGALLRRTREKHGQNLPAIADALCIRAAYLEAIEAGRYEDLPGSPYAMGFLRSYAEFLSLDAEHILRCFKEECSQANAQQELVIPEPMAEIRRPALPLIMASLVFLAAAAGGWVYFSKRGPEVGTVTPSVSERLQNMFEDLDGADSAQSGAPAEAGTPALNEPDAVPETEYSGDGIFREEVEEDQLAVTPELETVPSETADEPAAPEEGQAVPADEPAANDSDASLNPEAAPQDSAEAPATDLAQAEPEAATDSAEVAATVAEAALADASAGDENTETQDTAALETAAAETAAAETAAAETVEEPAETAAGPEIAEAEVSQAGETDGNGSLLQNASVTETASSATAVEAVQTASLPAIPGVEGDAALQTAYAREPVVYGEASEDTRIVLKAQQDAWVQVRDSEENLLLTRVLRSGDLYYVPDQEGLTLLTGNAGGLEIQVDGMALPQIGPVGVVRRDIPLEPTKLLDGSAFRR